MSRLSSALMVVIAGTLFSAQPVAAEVIKQGDGSFVTRDAVVVKAAPGEAWQALITPSKWWSNSHTWSGDAENLYISPQGGGCFCELLPIPNDAPEGVRRGSAHHMTVVLADPPKALRMRGGLGPLQSEPVEGVLTITLTPSDKGTAIVFEYVVGGYMRFETADIAKAVDNVMSQQLVRLAKLLGPVVGTSGRNEPEAGAQRPGQAAEKPDAAAPSAKAAPNTQAKKSPSVDEAFSQIADE